MTNDEALTFLRDHQPLPPSNQCTNELTIKLDEVRKHFLTHPDVRCIPLFLGVFNDGDGHGVFQLIENVLVQFQSDDVIPALRMALRSPSADIQYWCVQIASRFPLPQLVPELLNLAKNGSDEVRDMALTGLMLTPCSGLTDTLQRLQESEIDPAIQQHFSEIIELRRMRML